MSYILDALRRADAERERGAVPGLHSQPPAPSPASPAAQRANTLWIAVGAGVAFVLLVGAFVGLLTHHDAPLPEVAAPPVVRDTPAAPPNSALLAPQAPPPAMPPAMARVMAPVMAPATAPLPPAPRAVAAEAAVPALPARASEAVVAEGRLLSYEQLPDDIRRQLPVLQLGGAIYSDNPGSRMLIVGGQLLHEGDTIAPGLTLELIKPRSAVLRWKDLHYEMAW